MKMPSTLLRAALIILAAMVLGGCAGTVKNMREAPVASAVELKPEPGKALVVFMRPSTLGFAIQSSVFDVKNDQPELIGIVAAKAKVAYQAAPGKHLFMVIGESADYMEADLVPDRTYYAYVTPRMGLWKARFSLEPVKSATLETATFKGEFTDCVWVEKTSESAAWARENMGSVLSKHTEYFKDWNAAPADKRPTLTREDGR